MFGGKETKKGPSGPSHLYPMKNLQENSKSLSSRGASLDKRKVKSNMNVIKSLETRLSLPEISDQSPIQTADQGTVKKS